MVFIIVLEPFLLCYFSAIKKMLKTFVAKSHQYQKILCQCPQFLKSSALAYTTYDKSQNYLLESAQIHEAIKVNPKLASTPIETWHRAHETFINHGLYTSNFLRIATGNPSVLTRSPKRIIESVENWRSCQFGEKLLHLMLTKYPEFLDITDSHKLMTQINFLRQIVGSNKNVWKLLMNCPDVLDQPQEKIQKKINYLKDVMRLDIPEIIKSQALSKNFEEIRCRHVFQERLGIFKPRALKADPNERTTNNRLYKITDTSDKTFSTKICHVHFEEYEAFRELFQREVQQESISDEFEESYDSDNE